MCAKALLVAAPSALSTIAMSPEGHPGCTPVWNTGWKHDTIRMEMPLTQGNKQPLSLGRIEMKSVVSPFTDTGPVNQQLYLCDQSMVEF